jgi:hypothetical protein
MAGVMTEELEPGASPETSADRLAVQGQDERGACLQLAARWAELYPPAGAPGDAARGLLTRFRTTHAFIEAVVQGIEPPSPVA